MNYLDLYSSYPDHTIAAAWDCQIKEANKSAWIADPLNQRGNELFLRFAARYAELRELPRGARRSLQRKLARSSELAAILPEFLQHGGRRLQHRMAWSLAGAALLLALSQGIGTAATIAVTTSDPNIVADGQCSLIEAIINANNDAATHADCGPGSGADTIVLPAKANVTLTNVTDNIFGPTGLPLITSPITIQGNGATIARQGNAPTFRLIAVNNSGDLTLQNLTLSGGYAFESDGGGIYNHAGVVAIQNSTISQNRTKGVQIYSLAGHGGGICNYRGIIAIENSTISGNAAAFTGGGVSSMGTLTITGSTVSGNSTHHGGGVHNSFGPLSVENSEISGNRAATGGGLSNLSVLSLQNSTISYNTAYFWGGGVSNNGSANIENSTISANTAGSNGGGVYNSRSLTVENSTISGNTANIGGGAANAAGNLTLNNSTVSGNIANNSAGGVLTTFTCFNYYYSTYCYSAALAVNRSLIAGNLAPAAPEINNISDLNAVSVVTANNFNLLGTNGNAGVDGFTPGPTDIIPAAGISIAQILGPLANNGGPTQTHALVAGSPAIDSGDTAGCRDSEGALLQTDQRGFARHIDGNNDGNIRCDIGAFEFGAIPASLVIGSTTLPTGEVGVFLTSDLMIFGGVAPYVASITQGKLPKGLSLGNDGIISGPISPTARTEKITVRITDAVNESISKTFTITVLKALRIAGNLRTGRVGKDYIDSLKPRGGLGPFGWNITSGAVPGLSFNNATGALTGIPTQAGEFPLSVQVSDALGGIAVENLTLKIR